MSSNDINSPKHYKKKDDSIECIEAIEESMTPEKFQGHLKGTVMKYLWRYEDKAEPLKDLKKAQVYLDWLIRKLEGKPLFDKADKAKSAGSTLGAPLFVYRDGYTARKGDFVKVVCPPGIHHPLLHKSYIVSSVDDYHLRCLDTERQPHISLFFHHFSRPFASKHLHLVAREGNYSL